MKQEPPACFVVPFHPEKPDAVRLLLEATSSILAQTDPRWRLVIVHDPVDGTPGTRNALDQSHRYPQSPVEDLIGVPVPAGVVVRLQARSGPGWARNVGVDWAVAHGAPFVVFLDADDVCEPERLASITQAFERHPRADVVYSSFSVIDEHSLPRADAELPAAIAEILHTQQDVSEVLLRPWKLMACERGYMSLTSTVAVRSDLAVRYRFPHTHVSEDTHAWLRMFAAAEEVVYLADRLTRYRVPRGAGVSASRARVGDSFYWTKALVDADACLRVLLDEVAEFRMTPAAAGAALDAFWRKTSSTLDRACASTPAAVVDSLAHRYPEGSFHD